MMTKKPLMIQICTKEKAYVSLIFKRFYSSVRYILIRFSPHMSKPEFILYTFFLYKKHVYKKHEAEIRQKVRNIGRLSFQ